MRQKATYFRLITIAPKVKYTYSSVPNKSRFQNKFATSLKSPDRHFYSRGIFKGKLESQMLTMHI